jgi:hypothetical protein
MMMTTSELTENNVDAWTTALAIVVEAAYKLPRYDKTYTNKQWLSNYKGKTIKEVLSIEFHFGA